jgi:hypothetical protein
MKHLSESTLKKLAELQSETIVVRSYTENGSSQDTIRKATESEQQAIYGIIYGALLAINDVNYNVEMISGTSNLKIIGGIISCAEYTAIGISEYWLEEMNCYDTIYKRIIDTAKQQDMT